MTNPSEVTPTPAFDEPDVSHLPVQTGVTALSTVKDDLHRLGEDRPAEYRAYKRCSFASVSSRAHSSESSVTVLEEGLM